MWKRHPVICGIVIAPLVFLPRLLAFSSAPPILLKEAFMGLLPLPYIPRWRIVRSNQAELPYNEWETDLRWIDRVELITGPAK